MIAETDGSAGDSDWDRICSTCNRSCRKAENFFNNMKIFQNVRKNFYFLLDVLSFPQYNMPKERLFLEEWQIVFRLAHKW